MIDYIEFDVTCLPGAPNKICVAQGSANVKNRYMGVFTFHDNDVQPQLIVFGRDLMVQPSKNGGTELKLYDVTDDDDESGDITTYRWLNEEFVEIDRTTISPSPAR